MNNLSIKCPKCLYEYMECYDEDATERSFNGKEVLVEMDRYYECPKCKTNAVVSRKYKYYEYETGEEIKPDEEEE